MNDLARELSSRDPRLEVWRVNAFTSMPFTGNPAGVVPNADGLSEKMMLAIAGELNDITETVFISKPDVEGADIRLRYFTTTTEVDLCGHATMAALFTLGWLGRIVGDSGISVVRAQTPVGMLELGLQFESGKPVWASMEQLVPITQDAPNTSIVPEVLGLPESALSELLPIGCASTGLWACFVPLRDVSLLQEIQINRERIEEIWPGNPDFSGIYPFALVDERTTQGRFFPPPAFGIVEDPVTGTACGALGGFLISQGATPDSGELIARQGIEMGREGMARVSRNPNGKMKIQGQAVAIFRGETVQ